MQRRITAASDHAQGTIRDANGDTYTGEWINDRPEGFGTTEYADGRRLEGRFVGGKANGPGTLFKPDGGRYIGVRICFCWCGVGSPLIEMRARRPSD